MSSDTGLPVIPVASNSGLFWGRNAFLNRSGVLHVAIGHAIEVARRPELLARIETGWRELEKGWNAQG